MALRWQDVDLAAGIIRVERGWDDREGVIELKSRAGRRRVPIAAVLREQLLEHRLRTGRGGEGLVFGRDAETPFSLRGPATAPTRRGRRPGSSGSRCTSAGTPSPR